MAFPLYLIVDAQHPFYCKDIVKDARRRYKWRECRIWAQKPQHERGSREKKMKTKIGISYSHEICILIAEKRKRKGEEQEQEQECGRKGGLNLSSRVPLQIRQYAVTHDFVVPMPNSRFSPLERQ